jgi:hypothetical protein
MGAGGPNPDAVRRAIARIEEMKRR